MNRRPVLLGIGTLLSGAAGCTTRSDSDETTDEDTTLGFSETYEGDGFEIAFDGITVQSSILYLDGSDSAAVIDDSAWYVFLTYTVEGELPLSVQFELTGDDESNRGWQEYRGIGAQYLTWFHDEIDDPGGGDWIGFNRTDPLPDDATPTIALQSDERLAEWRLPEPDSETLSSEPPEFTLESVADRETAPAGEPFDVEIVVGNEGGAGAFRGAFNYRSPVHAAGVFEERVEAGETASLTHTISGTPLTGSESGDVVEGRFRSVGGDREFSIELD